MTALTGHRSPTAPPEPPEPPAQPGAPGSRGGDTLMLRFPARSVPADWPATRLPAEQLLTRLLATPFVADHSASESNRRRGLRLVVAWLQDQPGHSWQQRWLASGAGADGRADWRRLPIQWARANALAPTSFDAKVVATALLSLVCADVIRPDLAWLLTTTTPKRLATEMARTRDPAGFAALTERCAARPVGECTTRVALHRVAALLAAKGGLVADITQGDGLQLLSTAAHVCTVQHFRSPYFYQLLHAVGVFGPDAAPTVSILAGQRQLTVEQLIDRCGIANQPVRALLVDYLTERQICIDHVSLIQLANALGRLFWRDLETHHPGIGSLRLPPPVAAAWKQRILTKTTRHTQPDGSIQEVLSSRRSATNALSAVRTFYLDIAQWATEDPARWDHGRSPARSRPARSRTRAK